MSNIDRLIFSDDAIPRHYEVSLEPDLDRCLFIGSVKITYDIDVATNEIHLHAKELVFNEVYFEVVKDDVSGPKMISAEEISFQPKETVVRIRFEDFLPTGKGSGKLVIPNFQGILNDQMAGFYRSEYKGENGEMKRMALTQFEPIDARRCFPCVDEPGRKAIFKCSLTVANDLTAVSNMPVKKSTVIPGDPTNKPGSWTTKRIKYDFEETPTMSTYLIAFLVGELDTTSATTKEGTKITCYAVPGKASELEFSVEVGVKALEFYNDFFKLPYPLPKLDMAAIPDFAAGAMENWGLVTYREIDLLCDPSKASVSRKTRIATVVTHELAHQWFGNLVTMEWWNDLWLNEGFANFMQTYSADHIFPEWRMWEQYVCKEQASALRLDSLRSSHPIQVPIPRAEQVDEIFDAISYCKGGSVVRMIFATLGREKFQEGLQLYMERFKYQNTQTYDLWGAWEEVSGKPISKMMRCWTEKMGFPLLSVEFAEEDPKKIKISQKWYLADKSEEEGDSEKLWIVPLLFASDQGYDTEVQFMDEQLEQKFDLPTGAHWVKLNAGQFVPLRVMYSEKVMEALNIPSLCSEDRIGLLFDTYDLFKSGYVEPDVGACQVFRLLGALKDEQNPNVWDAIKLVLDGLEGAMQELSTEVFESYKAFVASLVGTPFRALGWDHKDGDDDLEKHLRGMMVSLNATYNSASMAEEADKRLSSFLADPSSKMLPDDYKTAVFIVALKSSRAADVWTSLVDLMKQTSTVQADKLCIYATLGHAEDIKLKEKTLQETFSIKIQDFFYPMSGTSSSGKAGNELVFRWMKENWLQITDRIKSASGMLLQAVVRCCCSGSTSERAEEIEAFFADKQDLKMITRTLKQVVERTRVNARFVEILKKSCLNGPDFWEGLGKPVEPGVTWKERAGSA